MNQRNLSDRIGAFRHSTRAYCPHNDRCQSESEERVATVGRGDMQLGVAAVSRNADRQSVGAAKTYRRQGVERHVFKINSFTAALSNPHAVHVLILRYGRSPRPQPFYVGAGRWRGNRNCLAAGMSGMRAPEWKCFVSSLTRSSRHSFEILAFPIEVVQFWPSRKPWLQLPCETICVRFDRQ